MSSSSTPTMSHIVCHGIAASRTFAIKSATWLFRSFQSYCNQSTTTCKICMVYKVIMSLLFMGHHLILDFNFIIILFLYLVFVTPFLIAFHVIFVKGLVSYIPSPDFPHGTNHINCLVKTFMVRSNCCAITSS